MVLPPRQSDKLSRLCVGWRICLFGNGRVAPLAMLLVTSSAATPAQSHEIIPGIPSFASVFLHPFVAVDTLLPMIGLALVMGASRRPLHAAVVVSALLIGAGFGVLLQHSALLLPGLWRVPLVLAFALGVLASMAISLPKAIVAVLLMIVGAVVSLALPPERPGVLGRFEVWAAAIAAILVVLAVVLLPRRRFDDYWLVRLGGQIIGAWIIAISLLGMALSLR